LCCSFRNFADSVSTKLARFSVNGYRGRDNCVDHRADEASVFFNDLAGSLSSPATLMTGREHQGVAVFDRVFNCPFASASSGVSMHICFSS
jgi:hypothetical protein